MVHTKSRYMEHLIMIIIIIIVIIEGSYIVLMSVKIGTPGATQYIPATSK